MITLDFETYHTTDYSLRRLTTEQYIRNNSFETLGVGIQYDAQPPQWFAGGVDTLRGVLAQIDWDQPVLAHNAFFDMAILSWVFGIRPKFILDTLCMAKPKHAHDIGVSLDALADYYELGRKGTIEFKGWHPLIMTPEQSDRLGEYCCNDVTLTYKLFQILRRGFPAIELAVINKLIRLYSEPSLLLDVAYLQDFATGKQKERDAKIAALEDILQSPITEINLASNPQFAALLMKVGAAVPLKSSPTRPGVMIPALAKTDPGFKVLLSSDDDIVRLLAEARLGVKSVLDRTRAAALIEVGQRGALPVMLNYYGAHTGRFSGGEKLNPQNLPRNGKLRRALVAPPGYVVIASDSSQIEARLTAWLAGQLDLLQQFRDYDIDPKVNTSPYEIMASTIYGRRITSDDLLERFVGKTCILGLGYGMGAPKLQMSLKIGQGGISVDYPLPECHNIVGIYRNKNHRIKNLWKDGERVLHAIHTGQRYSFGGKFNVDESGIELPNGMRLTYAGLEPNHRIDGGSGWAYCNASKILPKVTLHRIRGEPYSHLLTKIYGAKVVENTIQAVARIVNTEHMLLIGRRYNVVLQVHDEIVSLVREEEADEAAKYIKEVMTTPPTWAPDLPVNCSIGIGKSYGEC